LAFGNGKTGGVSTTIAAVAVATAVRVLYDEDNSVISVGCLEIFKKIITLLTVTIFLLFAFFNLILVAPRTSLFSVINFRRYAKINIQKGKKRKERKENSQLHQWFIVCLAILKAKRSYIQINFSLKIN
jgi:hypothetical protein